MGRKKSKKQNGKTLDLVAVLVKERGFLTIILLGFVLSAILVGFGQAAMWLGFIFAAYATVANDSIQSLGTFIESNQDKKWWILWLYIGGIFIVTVTFSWFYYNGDVTYQRLLSSDGTSEYPHPENFNYFQVIAPLILLILTRLRMPVSTTFLMLSVFSASSSGIVSVVSKSLSGYGMAFILSFLVWYFSYGLIRKYFYQRFAHNAWSIIQWIVSGALWAVWVMQDGANVAVFLPRQQTWWQFLIFSLTIFVGLGILFYLKGDKIQKVVSEKARISDVRAATLIDLTYVLLLVYKLFISTVPMSTTWVFLGIIGGREIAVNLSRTKEGRVHKVKSLKMIGKDVSYAAIGLFVSLALASGANPAIRDEIISYFVPIK
ncbi:hypothetical protein [Acidiluteibacter ferrifornacis]|uniref:Phosphate/sulfate permease n=1 Tax=Acidiluteibacter ferrifornacis TaxID=2692424 RepID=A0A6N9NI85_9FLAO|nr:hypothetical protein [Acidiluteibacter ferrifornacis]NBG66388.1 hypothetical protein [Acidiluteibacter ferrifornacis]